MKSSDYRRKAAGFPEDAKAMDKSEFRVYSWSAAEEYFKYRPDAVKRILVRDGFVEKIKKLMEQHGIRVDLSVLPPGDGSLGLDETVAVVVNIRSLSESELHRRLDSISPNILVLIDHITDPRNLGAIIRSCAFFGVSDVVLPSRRQVHVTNASVNTAQGGFALTSVTIVPNLTTFIKTLKSRGYWVIGTDMSGTPLKQVAAEFKQVALVVGSEEKGLSELVKKNCDVIATITSCGRTLESLNVSVALGICLYELRTFIP